jgi:hypothetical protein
MRIANQNEASLPSAKQNTREDRDPGEKMNKKRKKRTLKDLVRICEELGDRSDKSKLLTRWKNYRKDPDWKALTNGHIKNTIHELVIKLENFYKDLQTGGEASGKGRDVIRERYWESSPLTTPSKFATLSSKSFRVFTYPAVQTTRSKKTSSCLSGLDSKLKAGPFTWSLR